MLNRLLFYPLIGLLTVLACCGSDIVRAQPKAQPIIKRVALVIGQNGYTSL
jgi:hypothetical protein